VRKRRADSSEEPDFDPSELVRQIKAVWSEPQINEAASDLEVSEHKRVWKQESESRKPKTANCQLQRKDRVQWNLEFNKRALVKEFNAKTQLSPLEAEQLKSRVSARICSLERTAKSKYDSQQNWSIMIKRE
jgi:hypothetical protein